MPKKILLTDDDKDLVDVMALRLEKEGYLVLRAFDGEECLEKAQAELPDLVIMDVSMPRMDGYSAVKAFKTDEKLKNIPIIILTGKDQMEDIFKVEGVKEYLVKPFDFDMIAEKISKILQTDE